MSGNMKMDTSSGDKTSLLTSTKGIFWDAFDYISNLVRRTLSPGYDSNVASTSAATTLLAVPAASASAVPTASASAVPTASAPASASTDECKDVFTGINSSINAPKYVINISINGKPLQLRLPDILELSNSSIGLVALSDNELVALPNFNKSNQTQQISMTQYYRANSSNNCVVIHLTTTTLTKLTCERYICVHYDEDNNIVSAENENFDKIIDYSEFENWGELNTKCAGIVPDPRSMRTKLAFKYLFNNTTYRDELQTTITDDKKSNQASFKAKAQMPKGSVRSPVEATIEQMGTSLRMDDMMNHGVDGLSEVAVKRYNGDINRVRGLNIDQTIKSIKDQFDNKKTIDERFKTELEELIKTTCAINDFTDLAHDVRTLQNLDEYIGMVFPTNTQRHVFLTNKLNSLLTSSKNINVPNSHKIQEENVKELKQFLLVKGIIIPNIPTEKYESRYEMYVQLIVDLMQGVERRNYPESGKQITIETFYEFYKKLDTDNQILFCQDVQNRIDEFLSTNAVASSSASAPASAPASLRKNSKKGAIPTESISIDNTIGPLDPTTQSVEKICGLDGCPIGVVDKKTPNKKYIIENIYGLYDFEISGSNQTTWTITITRHDDDKIPKIELLKWKNIPGDFHIILDDVIWYVKQIINENDTTFNDLKYRNKNYINTDHSTSQDVYKPIVLNESLTIHEKTLLVYSLKTAMDKLYSLSGEILTEIGTIDSYVWGDPYIKYLLGYLQNLLMIYRVSDATGDGEQDDGECDVDTHALGGRGLVVHPMVKNVYTNEEGILLMKKTLVYANWLQQLADMSGGVAQSVAPASPGVSQSDGAYSVDVPIPLNDVFNLKEFTEDGKLFYNTEGHLGSLIPTDIRMSNRLLNFVERLGFNSDIKANDKDEYDKTMVDLFNQERYIVIRRVQEYIKKLREIMSMPSLTDENKSAIRNAIIKLADLEDLLGMSSPTYYVFNEDTLIDMSLYDTPRITITDDMVTSSSDDLLASSDASPASSHDSLNINLFTDVKFLDNGNISITSSSEESKLAKMVNDTNKEYKLTTNGKNNVITGPITLELLYKLKKYAPNNPDVRKKITDKIHAIIEAFKSSFLSDPSDADTAYSSSHDEGMSATSYVSGVETDAFDRGYTDGLNNSHAKSTGIEDSISRAYELGYNAAIGAGAGAGAGATYGQDNGSSTPDGTKLQMNSGSGSESDNEVTLAKADAEELAKAQAKTRNVRQHVLEPIAYNKRKKSMRLDGQQATLNPRPPAGPPPSFRYGTTKSGTRYLLGPPFRGGNRNNSTRKPSKIPRRTIRRRAPRRGQKRTIRRRRNKKGTQKRRK